MVFPIAFAYPAYLFGLLLLAPTVWLWWLGRTAHSRVRARRADARRIRDAFSLILRVSILLLLVFSLAGLQWVRASDELAVVFALDVSDSVDVQARKAAVDFVRAALVEMGPDDRAALVLFGSDALVERPLSQAQELGDLLSIPATAHTDVGEAVRLGLALLPATAQRRIVLLSDGMSNVPGAEMSAQLAAASGVELDVVPLPAREAQTETWIDGVDVPTVLYEGEQFGVTVRVRSTVAQRAKIRLFADDALVVEEFVLLNPGLNSFLFELDAAETGFSTFYAQLVPEEDTFYQNNLIGAFALVKGAPRVLLVARPAYVDEETGQRIDDAELLFSALQSANVNVERVTPAYLPADLAALGEYAAVVLVNVPAPEISPRQMELLQAYVRDLGRGLVCVGGEESYGVGGYFKTPLEETLPVEMTIKDKKRMPPLAIVFVIDKSGSMDMAASPGSPKKIDLAKEAVLRSLELLNEGDQVGVIGFESTAQWVWNLAPLEDIAAVQTQVMTMRGGGGTDIYAGLDAAVKALEASDARLKHVILLTDGGASQEGLTDLVARLRAMNGTLSTVGVGQDAAPFLQALAIDGGGRYHFTDNPSTIPQIFAQETTLAQRSYIIEETFYPSLAGRSPILEGIEIVPALYGYVAASPKPAAQTVFVSAQGDPILAQWQYGLGRAVAWTSDAAPRWAHSWVTWEQFGRFWAQAVRWTMVEREESGLETQIVDDGEKARIAVDVVSEKGEYGNALTMEAYLISPSLETQTVVLRQTAPGRYEGSFVPEEEGVYLVRISGVGEGEDASVAQITGFVRAYSTEYRAFGVDEVALDRLAEGGSGAVFTDPAQVFVHDQDVVKTYSDVWPWLLGVAVCLLPLDVGVRRVTIDWSDLRKKLAEFGGRVRARFRRVSPAGQPVEARVSRLMSAKAAAKAAANERVPTRVEAPTPISPVAPSEARSAGGSSTTGEPSVAVEPTQAAPSSVEKKPSPAVPPSEPPPGDMTSRLLAAKRRAKSRDHE